MSYFKLAIALTREYVLAKINPQITTSVSTEKHEQWVAGLITITISELAPSKTLINFIDGDKTEAITVDWENFDVSALDKPTTEIQAMFDAYIDHKLNLGGKIESRRAPEHKDSVVKEEKTQLPYLGCAEISSSITQKKPADMPDFEDEYEIKGSRHASSRAGTGLAPIGDRDLNPPGLPRDPLMKPYIDPLAQNPDGGMYPSSNHPLFGRIGGNSSRLGVPPGARFDDPYGEDNLDDMGMGLPGNLRRGGPGYGGPGYGGLGFGGSGGPFSGSGFGF